MTLAHRCSAREKRKHKIIIITIFSEGVPGGSGEHVSGWDETVWDILEQRGFLIVGDSSGDCYFWACHGRLKEEYRVRASHWHQLTGEPMTREELNERAGAPRECTDVHWPLTLSIRPWAASTFRKRTPAALAKRQAKKAQRGYGPAAEHGRLRGSQSSQQWWSGAAESSQSGRPRGSEWWSGGAESSEPGRPRGSQWWSEAEWGQAWRGSWGGRSEGSQWR